ncbi:MAG TPA: zf-HC2 domain-containing protein [Lachnospiraceae bacterium]|nr:zf-HC2 domain-containing protein [Lachnospiraceae bacterium]
MKCQDMEQCIQLFIDNRLTGVKLQEFIEHIENCPVCYEEMETSYLLKEALLRLEDGDAFDLHSELLEKLSTMKRCAAVHAFISVLRRTILIAAGMTLLAELIYVYLVIF